MTRSLAYVVDVPDVRTAEPGHRRVAGVLADGATIAVGTIADGERLATSELEFSLGEALELAQACLSGHARALTTPGLSRKLSATVAILFRVAVVAGAVQQQGAADGPDDRCDRDEEDRDEDPGE